MIKIPGLVTIVTSKLTFLMWFKYVDSFVLNIFIFGLS